MADYEHTRSEGGFKASFKTGGGISTKPLSYVNAIFSTKESEKYKKENTDKNEKEYGRDITSYGRGRDDRLAGRPLNSFKCDNEDSQMSYYKGYVYGGNKQLKMTAENRMTELATLAYYGFGDKDYDEKKYGFPTRKEFASSKTPEYLYVMGYCDATHGIIEFGILPEEVRTNPNYILGWNDALKLTDTNKKSR